MSRGVKGIIAMLVLTVVLPLGTISGFASESIERIRLTFTTDTKPEAGQSIGSVTVTASGDKFTVGDANYVMEYDTWERGDVPKVRVELYANDGYHFYKKGKDNFTLSGAGATFKSASIEDGRSTLILNVTLKRVEGVFESVENLWWNGDTAHWDSVDGAKKYEVCLYRGDSRIDTQEVSENRWNFRSKMNREGDYSFRVRAMDSNSKNNGEWSDYSDSNYKESSSSSGSSSSSAPTGSTGSGSGTPAAKEGWRQDSHGWRCYYGNGLYTMNNWAAINGSWYFFDDNGYMKTGWIKWKDIFYYCDLTGKMLTNTRTPDGYEVDGNGAWIQSAPVQPSAPVVQPGKSAGIVEGVNGGPGVHR